jgi:hypothetical protein
MQEAHDEEIVVWSLGQKATVVTLDADFDALAVAKLVRKVLAGFAGDLLRGSLVTVKANKTTCHKLPIGGAD